MYCKKCGREIKEGINFCPYCGTALNAEKEDTELELNIKEDIIEEKEVLHENNTKDKLTTLLLILTIIAGILTCLPINIIVSCVGLALSILFGALSLCFYLKKSSKYYFFTLVLNLIFVLSNIALILFVIFLK